MVVDLETKTTMYQFLDSFRQLPFNQKVPNQNNLQKEPLTQIRHEEKMNWKKIEIKKKN
jgi:hypothetical protein